MKKNVRLLIISVFVFFFMILGNVAFARVVSGVETDPSAGANPIYGACNVTDNTISLVEKLTCVSGNVLDLLVNISFVAAVLALVLVGIFYITSAGDANRQGVAKKYFGYVMWGIFIISIAKVAIQTINWLSTAFV